MVASKIASTVTFARACGALFSLVFGRRAVIEENLKGFRVAGGGAWNNNLVVGAARITNALRRPDKVDMKLRYRADLRTLAWAFQGADFAAFFIAVEVIVGLTLLQGARRLDSL